MPASCSHGILQPNETVVYIFTILQQVLEFNAYYIYHSSITRSIYSVRQSRNYLISFCSLWLSRLFVMLSGRVDGLIAGMAGVDDCPPGYYFSDDCNECKPCHNPHDPHWYSRHWRSRQCSQCPAPRDGSVASLVSCGVPAIRCGMDSNSITPSCNFFRVALSNNLIQ